MAFRSLLTRTSNINVLLQTNRTFKSDLKIKWVRPEKVPCYNPSKSGDLAPFPDVDKSLLPNEFRTTKDLVSADPILSKVLSLEYLSTGKTTQVAARQLIDRVKRHNQDTGSMEVRIASMTAIIRKLQTELSSPIHRGKTIKRCKELIDKRKKFLKYLRRWDYKRFEWLLEKLDLVYKPPPNEFHWITRKNSLRKLTDKYCNDLKDERLAAYRAELEAQQVQFLEEKLEKYKMIRQEQIDCDVPVTISKEHIDETAKQLDELRKIRQRRELDDGKGK